MKTGLRTAINNLLILLFIFNISLSAQIPVNGFLKLDRIKTVPGGKSLLTLNPDNDSYTDLLVFSSNSRNAYLLHADGSGGFPNTSAMRFRHAPNNIISLSTGKIYSRLFLSVSRKNRTASVISFGRGGSILTLNEMRFTSYPEIVDVADADLNQSPDMLLTGPAFDGISILQIKNGILSEKKVIERSAFRNAVFADYNNDGFEDIAAVNLFSSSLDFYRNNSKGKFQYERSFSIPGTSYTLSSTDMDLDYYRDFILSEKGRISVMYGDAGAAYNEKIVLTTTYEPHILVTGDFNGDGNIDITYTDTLSGIVSVIFGNDNRSFNEEFTILRKNNITSLVSFYSKFIRGIAVLDNTGSIYIISRLGSLSGDFDLTAGLKPGVLTYFDNHNNGLTDICFIDEDKSNIIFLIRNNEGIPYYIYTSKLHFPHQEITTDEYSKEIKYFYCWTRGRKLIEIIRADFQKNEFQTNSLYTSGEIRELSLKKQKGRPAVIYASYFNGNSSGVNIFEFHNFRYINADYKDFAFNVVDISPVITKTTDGFLTWQKDKNLTLSFYNLKNIGSPQILGKLDKYEFVTSLTGDFTNTGDLSQLVSLKKEDRKYIAIAGYRLTRIPVSPYIEINNSHQLWLGPVYSGGQNHLWIYLPDKKSLSLVTLFNNGKNLTLSEKISGININRYFVRNMSVRGYHVVYTDPEENCIKIRRLE